MHIDILHLCIKFRRTILIRMGDMRVTHRHNLLVSCFILLGFFIQYTSMFNKYSKVEPGYMICLWQ